MSERATVIHVMDATRVGDFTWQYGVIGKQTREFVALAVEDEDQARRYAASFGAADRVARRLVGPIEDLTP
jgi:hypothetical protein